jgi:hypothetical protein
VPIEVDTAGAPALLKFRVVGEFPSAEEQAALRERLIDEGLLTEDSVSLLDVREAVTPSPSLVIQSIFEAMRAGIPRRRACLINPARHLHILRQFQTAVPWMTTAAFSDEREAIDWLLQR